MNEIKEFIEEQYEMLNRGLVATPSEEMLDQFTKANNGSNDFLLVQMAKNYGYKLALELIEEILNKEKQ
jgi:ferritin-like metal-binding protein YciE